MAETEKSSKGWSKHHRGIVYHVEGVMETETG